MTGVQAFLVQPLLSCEGTDHRTGAPAERRYARLMVALVVAALLGTMLTVSLRSWEPTTWGVSLDSDVTAVGTAKTAARTLTIGSAALYNHSFWSQKPSVPAEYSVVAGTSLTFRYTSSHNVWRLPSRELWESCDFSRGAELAGAEHGGELTADAARLGWTNVFETVVHGSGELFLACQVSDHCKSGQKIVVRVRPGLDDADP